MQQKSRSKRMGRRHSMTGGAPLEPIYEHEGISCSQLQDTWECSRRKSLSSQAESSIQITAGSPPTSHPDFLHSHRSPSLSPSKTLFLEREGRWGNGDATKINKDSNSSINTSSTSSLTVSLYDADDYGSVDFYEDTDRMSSTEIIQQATDVVVGKYDFNNATGREHPRCRRRQARRSSLPLMPIRQESIQKLDVRAEEPVSSESEDSDTTHPTEKAPIQVDKFGIPIAQTSSRSRRRRQGRRSSLGDSPSKPFEPPQQVVDKFGIPIPVNAGETKQKRQKRQAKRSTLGDSAQGSQLVDKFGIPIGNQTRNKERRASGSDAEAQTKRKEGRRSSMPTRTVSFDLPPLPPPPTEEEMKEDSFYLRGAVSIPIDQFGNPMWPKGMSPKQKVRRKRHERPSVLRTSSASEPNLSHSGKPKRRGRRTSLPTLLTQSNAMRFSSDELPLPNMKKLQVSDRYGSGSNEAPIRPERVPSTDNFGNQTSKNLSISQPNASFGVLKPHKKDGSKLESIANVTLDDVFAKNPARAAGSDMSVNSFLQKDGEWWL